MKKEQSFNASIKYFNEHKTSDREQSEDRQTTDTWRWMLYIEEASKKQDTNYLRESFFHSFL